MAEEKRVQDAQVHIRCFQVQKDEIGEGGKLDGRKLGPFMVRASLEKTRRLRAEAKRRAER